MNRYLLFSVVIAACCIFFAFGLWTGVNRMFPSELVLPLRDRDQKPEDVSSNVINTTLLNFDLTTRNADSPIEGAGGGLAATDEGVLIAHSQIGDLHFYDRSDHRVHPIALRLPNNHFAELPDETESGTKVDKRLFRYNDIELIGESDAPELLVSYTHFNPERACFTNRLAVRTLQPGWHEPVNDIDSISKTQDAQWEIVHETHPCVPFAQGRMPFRGSHAGGRLTVDAEGFVYLSVGDFGFNGIERGAIYPQETDTDYGKVLRLDPRDWSSRLFTLGHRNPQGITIDAEGRIWSVEHGPMGGDELNLLEQGKNYGWPHVTLGVDHVGKSDDKNWPLNEKQGRHEGYQLPAFAWLPSVAVSNIKHVEDLHPNWDGDLLASTLRARSLLRIRVIGGDPIYAEHIPLGERVRYAEIGNGEIYLLFDGGKFATLSPRNTEPSSERPNAGAI